MARIHGDLKERTLRFAESILNMTDQLPNSNKGWVVGRQLIRCGTSVGANLHEADQAISDADFSFKCGIARKEASETQYWLELCRRTGMLSGNRLTHTAKEADEIMRILASMVKRTEDRLKRSR
jgi:four helix bundle protein